MYCLDTDVIIGFLRGVASAVDKIDSLKEKGLYITPITLCELFKGAYLSTESKSEIDTIKKFINNIKVANFTEESCIIFGKEYSRLHKSGKMTQEPDLMIASIAKANNLIVVTGNKKHFEHIDVKLNVF